jgi:hypothetical protein
MTRAGNMNGGGRGATACSTTWGGNGGRNRVTK